jgi:hypothetical protein
MRMIKSRKKRWAEYVASMGGVRNAYEISVGKPERRRPFGRTRHRWKDLILILISLTPCITTVH